MLSLTKVANAMQSPERPEPDGACARGLKRRLTARIRQIENSWEMRRGRSLGRRSDELSAVLPLPAPLATLAVGMLGREPIESVPGRQVDSIDELEGS